MTSMVILPGLLMLISSLNIRWKITDTDWHHPVYNFLQAKIFSCFWHRQIFLSDKLRVGGVQWTAVEWVVLILFHFAGVVWGDGSRWTCFSVGMVRFMVSSRPPPPCCHAVVCHALGCPTTIASHDNQNLSCIFIQEFYCVIWCYTKGGFAIDHS